MCDNDFSNVNGSSFNPTGSWKLEETIPDYFSGIVLMRSAPTYPHSFTALRFQTLFNIVVIWMAVFIALSKGRDCCLICGGLLESISPTFYEQLLRQFPFAKKV